MCAIAYYLEREGIATVAISLVHEHAEGMAPPRSLWVPFPLGRPLGRPNDAPLQTSVFRAALDLLERPQGPVLEAWDGDEADDEQAEQWACPVSFPQETNDQSMSDRLMSDRLKREVAALAPWHNLAREQRNRSTVGASHQSIDALVEALIAFAERGVVDRLPRADKLTTRIKLATEDLRAYCLEAAGAQPSAEGRQTSPADAINDWFWFDTEAANLIRAVRERCLHHDDRHVRALGLGALVPRRALSPTN
ncbi:MAG: hypothetical protein AAF493_09395 [Pseudomonadota bacterium]